MKSLQKKYDEIKEKHKDKCIITSSSGTERKSLKIEESYSVKDKDSDVEIFIEGLLSKSVESSEYFIAMINSALRTKEARERLLKKVESLVDDAPEEDLSKVEEINLSCKSEQFDLEWTERKVARLKSTLDMFSDTPPIVNLKDNGPTPSVFDLLKEGKFEDRKNKALKEEKELKEELKKVL